MIYNSLKGNKYDLIESSGKSGGEGTVYRIKNNDSICAKIVNKPSQDYSDRIKRLWEILNKRNLPLYMYKEYAWPKDILKDDTGNIIGFTMDFINHDSDLEDFYLNTENDWKTRITVARNLCVAVHNLHTFKQIYIGDFNPQNIFIKNNREIILIDCDSYKIRKENSNEYFKCSAVYPEFYSPEYINERNDNCITEYSDRFSLAILIFSILINGRHPFYNIDESSFMPNSVSPYFKELNKNNELTIPPDVRPLNFILPVSTIKLFKRTFVDGRINKNERPSARDWFKELKFLEQNIKQCTNKHYYYKNLNQCPWCAIKQKIQIVDNRTSLEIIKEKIKNLKNINNIYADSNFYINLNMNDDDIINTIKELETEFSVCFKENEIREIKRKMKLKTLIDYFDIKRKK